MVQYRVKAYSSLSRSHNIRNNSILVKGYVRQKYLNDTFNTTSTISEDFESLAIKISYGFLTVFVLTTNLMLIYGFYKTSRPFTIITKLFIYLSMVDIVMNFMMTFYTSLSIFDIEISCPYVYIVAFYDKICIPTWTFNICKYIVSEILAKVNQKTITLRR